MTGRLYIDGMDAYTEYGVYVTEGGWNDLVAYPPLKAVEFNDWQEMDGIEADLSAPVLNSREVQLKIAIGRGMTCFIDLMNSLADGAYHTFYCAYIQRTYRLRLVSMPNIANVRLLGTTTLRLADDFPLYGYSYLAPSSSIATVNDYTIDDVPFTNYGVRVLQGTLEEVMRTPNVKPLLLRNISSHHGALYDSAGDVTYKSKDVKIFCLMRAETLTELWRNYDALLYDLIRPNERSLYVDILGLEFPFHYRNCQVTTFYPTDKIWLQFTLTLTFTTAFRIENIDVLLSSESGDVITTENTERPIQLQTL